ncbi:MAG TPA: hypothetical protein VG603_09245 [Chitinophagales bacterium]|nr:hypothetical protein [Chitinophagales bacterium]
MDFDVKNTEQWNSKLSRIVNSAACFTLAYIFFTYVQWFAMAFAGHRYKFGSFIYYYGVKFIMSSNWDRGKVTFIYLIAPFTVFIMALVFLFIYASLRRVKTIVNLFFLWGFVIGTCIFTAQGLMLLLGAYHYDSPYYQHFAVALAWWRAPKFAIYLLSLLLAAMFFYFAINYGKPFLVFAYSFAKVNKLTRRRKYFFETAMVPFVVGAFITSALTYPMNMSVHGLYLGVIGFALVVTWYTLSYADMLKADVLRYKSLQTPSIPLMLTLIIVCAVVYVTFRGVFLG